MRDDPLAVAGWWYVRNGLLYGDPLAFNVWVAIAGGRPVPVTLTGLLHEFQGFRISYWGNFGGVNIIAPEWVYTVLDAFAILAGIGLGVGLLRRSLPRLLALPGSVVGAHLALIGSMDAPHLRLARPPDLSRHQRGRNSNCVRSVAACNA